MNRLVALKVIRPKFVHADLLARFRQEAQALTLLDHPLIVKIHDFGTWSAAPGTELPYLVLEHVNGKSLDRHLGYRLALPSEAIQLMLLLARAVQHAHQQGVVHRDLEPGNVLLAPASDNVALNCAWSCPRLADFGVARLVEGEGRSAGPGTLLGTPAYMAPEQTDGREVDERTNVYGLCGILYWLLTHQHPLHGRKTSEILERVRSTPPRAPRELRHEIPERLSALCLACLEKEAAARPSVATLHRGAGAGKPGTTRDHPKGGHGPGRHPEDARRGRQSGKPDRRHLDRETQSYPVKPGQGRGVHDKPRVRQCGRASQGGRSPPPSSFS